MKHMKLFRLVRYAILQVKGYVLFRKRVGILGNFTVVNPKNVTIGANCGINHDVFILGQHRVEIGCNVVLSARVMILDSGLDLESYAMTGFPAHCDSRVRIEDGVWVGAGAIILPGVTVGHKCIVGAGSVVTKDVPPFTIVAGNPARAIGRTDG